MAKALAALSLAAVILTPSYQTTQPTFRSRADLVQVDVVVVDGEGMSIRGLKSTDFALYDRKKPQSIATFDEYARDAAPPPEAALPPTVRRDVATNQTPQAGRLIVMVVDDLHIYKDRTDRAKDIARRVIGGLGPQSSMAVLFTSGEHSTVVMDDPSGLLTAVDTLKGRQSVRRPHQASDKQTGDKLDPEAPFEVQLKILQNNQDTNVQQFFDNMRQYNTLKDAARMLGGGDTRRKAFVLLSEGIGKDLTGIFGAMTPVGVIPQGDRMGPPSLRPQYHDVALVDMMEAMRRSNVATYAIDPRGRVESKDLPLECFPPPRDLGGDPCSGGTAELPDWVSAVRQAQHGLEIMSEASGGFAVTNTDDFTSGIQKIVDDLDHYYLLGFYPSDTKGNDWRRLDVEIPGHPEWKLRFRRGYLPGGPPPPPKNSNPMVALSAGVLPKSDLPLRLSAVQLPGAARGTTRIAMALEVTAAIGDLRDPDGRLRDTLKYEILVVDEKKKKVRSLLGLEGRLTLSPVGAKEDLPASVDYQVGETFELAPGKYELRVSATSAKLGKGGSVYLGVEIVDLRAAPISIGDLAIQPAEGRRVPVAPPSARRPPLPLPFAPSLDRVFDRSETLRVYFEGVTGGRPTASLQVVDDRGKVVRSHSPSFATTDPLRIDASVALDGIAPGPYILRAVLGDGTRTAVREIGFIVR